MWRGRFQEAREHYEALLACGYESPRHNDPRVYGGAEFGLLGYGMLGWVLWKLGYPDQAIEWCKKGVKLGHRSHHPLSRVWVLAYETFVHHFRRDLASTRSVNARLEAAAHDAGCTELLRGAIGATEGWCLVHEGRVRKGIDTLRDSWDDLRAKGLGATHSWCANLLADALRVGGRSEEGLEFLDRATAESLVVDETIYAAQTARIRGELLLELERPRLEEAETALREAIECAQAQGARSFELQAALSLARLLRDSRRSEQARDVLSGIYGWFTEGYDTADMQEAEALLADLGASP
jgi:tetratricopeptide (TPR) repeat protein